MFGDHPKPGPAREFHQGAPDDVVYPVAIVCMECGGRGVVNRAHLQSQQLVSEIYRSTECGHCDGFGWLWSDGVKAKACKDDRNVACGRVEQCAACPHKQAMALSGGAP